MSVYAFSLLFAGVLANQAGVPVPMVPALVAAGTLSAHAGTGMASSILVTVVAALLGDIIWYGLGRWWYGLGRWRGRQRPYRASAGRDFTRTARNRKRSRTAK